MKRSILVEDICQFLFRVAPASLAEEWDNVGLQLGSPRMKVRGILVSLDCTESSVQEANRVGANLIVTHHPLFFKPIRQIHTITVLGKLVESAIQNGIAVLSFHTNLDSAQRGLNDLLARQIGLSRIARFFPARDSSSEQAGLGRMGHVRKTSLGKFIQTLGERLYLKHFRYVGELDWPVEKVAVISGSGATYFLEAKKRGAQVLVSADAKYHAALDAYAEKIALIDIGHWASEFGMVRLVSEQIKQWLKSHRSDLPVFETTTSKDPFQLWVP